MKRWTRLALLPPLVFGCAGPDAGGTPADVDAALPGLGAVTPPPAKYAEPPVDPLDLDLQPDDILAAELDVSLREGEMQIYRFEKQAGVRYTIGLTDLDGDLDLYTDYRPTISRRDFQFVSWNYGDVDEQVDFVSTQAGTYYILVHGYEAARGTLQLYTAEPRDEVGWPVSWADDGTAARDMLGGGLNWLESYPYRCGRTPHPGLDLNFGATWDDLGLPALAVADGEVVASFHSGWGNLVHIRHQLSTGLEFWSLYGHLDSRAVERGDQILRGQTIGFIGATGADSPHLHFELRRSDFSADSFPCGQSAWSVESRYYDPATFIRDH